MTDEQIKKALECCRNGLCTNCPRLNTPAPILRCKEQLMCAALDLINRQKAEISKQKDYIELLDIEHEAIKISAVKECFEKVNKRLAVHSFTSNSTEYTDGQLDCMLWVDSEIYELEKEMAGEN